MIYLEVSAHEDRPAYEFGAKAIRWLRDLGVERGRPSPLGVFEGVLLVRVPGGYTPFFAFVADGRVNQWSQDEVLRALGRKEAGDGQG